MNQEPTQCELCNYYEAKIDGLCTYCYPQIATEVANGITKLYRYLAQWAGFERWCKAHGV